MLHNELCHKNKLIARNEQKSNLPKKRKQLFASGQQIMNWNIQTPQQRQQ